MGRRAGAGTAARRLGGREGATLGGLGCRWRGLGGLLGEDCSYLFDWDALLQEQLDYCEFLSVDCWCS